MTSDTPEPNGTQCTHDYQCASGCCHSQPGSDTDPPGVCADVQLGRDAQGRGYCNAGRKGMHKHDWDDKGDLFQYCDCTNAQALTYLTQSGWAGRGGGPPGGSDPGFMAAAHDRDASFAQSRRVCAVAPGGYNKGDVADARLQLKDGAAQFACSDSVLPSDPRTTIKSIPWDAGECKNVYFYRGEKYCPMTHPLGRTKAGLAYMSDV